MNLKFWGVRGSIPSPLSSQKFMSKIQAIIQQISVSDLQSMNTRERFISQLPKWLTSTVGGNSPCVELSISDNEVFIFDAGSGIRELGKVLIENFNCKIHIFLSHFHWDHIQGLPFFDPLYNPNFEIHFYSVKSDLEKLFYRIQFNELYKANHTYSGGLLDQINGTAKILSTKYFKRIGYKTSYLCGSTEYKFLKQNNII